jgi:PAS domain S-box-containing protein
MDDYYPSPTAGIFVCDQQGRILAFGRGAYTLSGFSEQELMGADLDEALELRLDGDDSGGDREPVETALEFGVRVMGKTMTIRGADGQTRQVTGDFFPALDDDGGLLAVLTPRLV